MQIEENHNVKKYEPLWGSWLVREFVGEGSFGKVYKIAKEEWGYTYESALKIISVPTKEQFREVSTAMDINEKTLMNYFEDAVKNIVNEIRVLYSLRGNSNIVGYEDHMVIKRDNPAGWDILIRMEYVKPLSKYMTENTMTKKDVIKIGIDICSALEVCTQRGIIHRDIKDENIFVSDYNNFKLGDFGISRELSRSGRAASMKGTPLFMAPEVLKSGKYDNRADLYSLGIVLYRLLNCGRMPLMPPYPQEIKYKDTEDALDRRMSGEALPLPLEAGQDIGDIILKVCSYDPDDRFKTANDMKKELEMVLGCMKEEEKDLILNLPGFRKRNENTQSTNNKQRTSSMSFLSINDTEILDESKMNKGNEDTLSISSQSCDDNNQSCDENSYSETEKSSILNGTVSIFGTQFKKRKLPDAKGNFSGNIINGGLVAYKDFWIYYSNISLDNRICKMKHDGSSAITINDEDSAWYVNVYGNWIYFSNGNDEESIYKMDLDGNRRTKINSDKSWELNVVGDWIYYSNESDGYKIYRVKTDGSAKTKLNNDKSYCINIQDDWIYYSNKSSRGNIFKMKTDGSCLERINSDDSDFLNVSGGFIYYCNRSESGKLYRIDTEGSERKKLSDDNISNINVFEDRIFYCNKSDGEKLYSIKTDGSDKRILCNDRCDCINLTDSWVFYCNKSENNSLYKILHNGTSKTAVGDEEQDSFDDEWFSLE